MSRVVIGLVDSEQGRDALALGAQLAQKLDARPVVVCALPYAAELVEPEQLERQTADLFDLARVQLDGLEPELRVAADRSPARCLYHTAEAEDAVAIVVGSTHRGAIGHVLPGSVATNLLSGAPCAVAVAPRGYAGRDDRRLLRIGIAFDGSAESWAALETGIDLARRLRAGLVLITAVAPPGYSYGEALSVLSAEQIHTAHQAEARRVLEQGLGRVPAELTADPRLINGEPGAALAEAAADVGLLVLGSRRYGPLRRTLLGSVSTAVIRKARCPVLVLPRDAGADPLRLAVSAATSDAAG
jgi:nucleotide-binding universal stress UspA family protein